MSEAVTPGHYITVDESMSYWSGLTADLAENGLPHSSKQPMKPANEGSELKSSACAESGIMLRVEVLEGKEVMAGKEFVTPPHSYNAGTGHLLRLVRPWIATGRVVIADSAFSSVQALIALFQLGLYFIGCVKTAHKSFPKQFLKNWYKGQPTAARGSFKHLSSEFRLQGQPPGTPAHPMHALCWQDAKPKMLIFNASTTIAAAPSERIRHSLDVVDGVPQDVRRTIAVPRPMVVKDYFDAFPVIDIHDHHRQGTLGIERRWQTETWWRRLFGTMWGIMIVNAYLAYRFEYKAHHYGSLDGCRTLTDFTGRLAQKLIFNMYLPAQPGPVAQGNFAALIQVLFLYLYIFSILTLIPLLLVFC